MPPQRADLVLASDVPDGEGDVLVLNGLDVETCAGLALFMMNLHAMRAGTGLIHTDGRDRGHDFTQLELIQDRGLTRGIQTHH